ncbi:hypothetical protein [Paenibacillus harenae]|uniref:hypothetical protein n=1 Tax=Paenibacillus harenae TaxID=306543 RepID=UPI00279308E9|nr:hypothetical protein [Paenibacillus harenae]MDQ0062662.1 hypothetical protein [Paenibacillus harenae]
MDMNTDQIEIREQEVLPEHAQTLLEQWARKPEWSVFPRVLPVARTESASANHYAIQVDDGQSWLLDMEKQHATILADAIPLKWTYEGNLLLWKPNARLSHYYIGLDYKAN